jgi:hypothetical protein
MNSNSNTGALNKLNSLEEEHDAEKNEKKIHIIVPKIINSATLDNDKLERTFSKSSLLYSPTSSTHNQYDNRNYNAILYQSSDVNIGLDRSLSPMYISSTSLSLYDDPWKTSSIGIKCISYKPIGCIFLTRRILDLYVTDGKRKIDILYSYSKLYKNKIKVPSIGTSIEDCSFCDTITLDFDPESTLFDLIMEVHIITQGASLERNSKNSIERLPLQSYGTDTDRKKLVNNSGSSSKDLEDDEEIISFTSSYDIKYLKTSNKQDNHHYLLNSDHENVNRNNNVNKTNESILLFMIINRLNFEI